MVTSRDVARLAGVSQPTVSRALRDDPKVSEQTKLRVREAASALGYAPNPIGRALSVGRSTRVGMVVTDLENQFYGYVISPLHDELTRLGYELILITESSESGPVTDHVVANGLAAVVLTTTTVDSVLPVRLRDRGVPFMYFNRIGRGVSADAVIVDPDIGLRELVATAVQLGHRRIGAVFGPRDTSTGEERERTLRALLEEQGVLVAGRHVRYGPFSVTSGYDACRDLLEADDPPTLVFCANDVVALGALNAAAELGVDVPGEVSIVGFDDLPMSSWALVRLTTVAYDLDAMARMAARMVVERIEGRAPQQARTEVFSTHFVQRHTLGPAAG